MKNRGRFRRNTERINDEIRVSQVRLIDADGRQVGIVATDKARDMAYEKGLDLVEVQADARPPVCRIMDYGKYKYDKSKRERAAKKKQHAQTVKEMRFSAKISDHDYGYKMKHVREFLLKKDKVKITVRFRGREITHIDLGEEVLEKLKKDVADIARVEQESKLEGRFLTMMLAPDSKKIAAYKAKKKTEEERKNRDEEQDKNEEGR